MARFTDVFIIGGGPAGLAAAIAARRRGLDVTIADGAMPPIGKACGEGIMPDGVAAARALGISLEDAGARPFPGIRFCHGRLSVEAGFPSGPGLGLRRIDLHRLLLEHASAAGVHMRWGTPVSGIEDVRARWIVGADGAQSAVRRWAGLETGAWKPPRFGFGRHYRVAPWTEMMELHWSNGCQLFVTPVAGDEVCVVVISQDPSLRLDRALEKFPEVHRRLAGAAATAERGGITGSRRLPRVTRGRVTLVGDASGSVDAISGEGICLLFQHALALAGALNAGDLTLYEAAHRRLRRRPEFMACLMLLLGRRRWLRGRAMRAMATRPHLFAGMLALHVGELGPFDALKNSLTLGWQMVAS